MVFKFDAHSFSKMTTLSNNEYLTYEDAINSLYEYCNKNMITNNKDEVIETFNQAIQQAFDVPTIYKKEGSNRYIPIRLKDRFTLNSDGDNEHIFIKSLNTTDQKKIKIIDFLIEHKWKILQLSTANGFSLDYQKKSLNYIEFNFSKNELLELFKKIDPDFSFDLETDHSEIQIDNPEKNDINLIERNKYLENQVFNMQKEIAKLKTQLLQQDQIKKLNKENVSSIIIKNAINQDEITLKDNDLAFISVLMKFLQNAIPIKAHKSQAKILQKIEDDHKDIKGFSKSRTDKVMKEANKIYKQLINK